MEKEKKKTSILLVDDDASIIELLSILLKNKGFSVCTAADGNKALQCIQEQSYDIVVTDLKMPDMDGYQLLDIIKTDYREHKVMVMSADLTKRENLLRRGALEAFNKPFNLKKFVEQLSILVHERRRSKRFNSSKNISCRVTNPLNDEIYTGLLIDISIDGALVELKKNDANELGALYLELLLPHSDQPFCRVDGTVVRTLLGEEAEFVKVAIYFDTNRDLKLLNILEPFIRLQETEES